jgi:GT2 family glycosyltransferase
VDPTSEEMARSPLDGAGLPGIPVLGFLAGASVIRRRAFLDAGGFDPRFFLGAEEGLLALDLAARGWRMIYLPSLLVRHAPSALRDRSTRGRLLLRNAIYTAILRLPVLMALADCIEALGEAARARTLGWVLRQTAASLPWLLRERHVIAADLQRALRAVRRQHGRLQPADGLRAAASAGRRPLLRRLGPRPRRARS